MLRDLFLGHEDDNTDILPEDGGADNTDGVLTPEDVMSMEEDIAEFTDGVSDAGTAQKEIEEAIIAADEVNDKIETIDAQLEAPEAQPEIAAVVATEALKNMVNRLGINPKKHKIIMLASHESIIQPIGSLQASREGFVEIAKAIADKIKELFAMAVKNVKALMLKLKSYFTISAKTVAAIENSLKKGTLSDSASFSESEVAVFNKRFAIVANMAKPSNEVTADVLNKNLILSVDSKQLNTYLKEVDAVIKGSKTVENAIADLTRASVSAGYIIKNSGKDVVLAYSRSGSRVKGLSAEVVNGKLNLEKIYGDYTANAEFPFPNKAEAIRLIETLKVNVRDMPKYIDAVIKCLNDAEKSSSIALKNMKESDAHKVNAGVKFLSVFANTIVIDSISDAISFNRSVLSYCGAVAQRAKI